MPFLPRRDAAAERVPCAVEDEVLELDGEGVVVLWLEDLSSRVGDYGLRGNDT